MLRVGQLGKAAHEAAGDVAFTVKRNDDGYSRIFRGLSGLRRGVGAGQRGHCCRNLERHDSQQGQPRKGQEGQPRCHWCNKDKDREQDKAGHGSWRLLQPGPVTAAFKGGHPGFGRLCQCIAPQGVDGGTDVALRGKSRADRAQTRLQHRAQGLKRIGSRHGDDRHIPHFLPWHKSVAQAGLGPYGVDQTRVGCAVANPDRANAPALRLGCKEVGVFDQTTGAQQFWQAGSFAAAMGQCPHHFVGRNPSAAKECRRNLPPWCRFACNGTDNVMVSV